MFTKPQLYVLLYFFLITNIKEQEMFFKREFWLYLDTEYRELKILFCPDNN